MVSSAPAFGSCLYPGLVAHRRHRPAEHRFVQNVCALLVDLDELPLLDRTLRLFSSNRPNLVTFDERDHGPRDGSSLKAWIERHLAGIGILLDGGAVRVLCFPRMFGFVFNPLSIWYCHRRDGALMALLLEVSNMAGERHGYLLSADPEERGPWRVARFARTFHVSDFIAMDAEYCCRIKLPGDRVGVHIRERERGELSLAAVWRGRRVPLTDSSLAWALARFPLMTYRIWTSIYWHAIQLVRKGVPRQRAPARAEAPRSTSVSYAGMARRDPASLGRQIGERRESLDLSIRAPDLGMPCTGGGVVDVAD